MSFNGNISDRVSQDQRVRGGSPGGPLIVKMFEYDRITTGRPVSPSPTRHLPGSAGKVEMMMERFWAGFQLHHPDDATLEGADRKSIRELRANIAGRRGTREISMRGADPLY